MGESSKSKKTLLAHAAEEAMAVETMGGRVHVRWDDKAQATPHGQIVFFAEFWPRPVCSISGYKTARCTTAAPTHQGRATYWAH